MLVFPYRTLRLNSLGRCCHAVIGNLTVGFTVFFDNCGLFRLRTSELRRLRAEFDARLFLMMIIIFSSVSSALVTPAIIVLVIVASSSLSILAFI
jgi:hypothetical protein